jgi:hypothetical protein
VNNGGNKFPLKAKVINVSLEKQESQFVQSVKFPSINIELTPHFPKRIMFLFKMLCMIFHEKVFIKRGT